MLRNATHSGSWYSNQGSKLNKELDQWLGRVPPHIEEGLPTPVPGARAIIAPHAGYSYSGPAAAYAYKCIDPDFVKRVFILGPSHHVYLTKCALSKCSQYKTPLGDLTLDTDVINKLRATGHFDEMTLDIDEDEHSIEMHLPYTYKILENKIDSIKIVPILVGSLSESSEAFYGKLFSPYLADPSNLFIISSDFCHWGHRFSYTYYSDSPEKAFSLSRKSNKSLTIPIHESIERLDHEGMTIIEHINHEEFASYLSKTKNTICGRHPIGVLLCAIEALPSNPDTADGDKSKPRIRFVHYAQSSKVTHESDSSVSYASAYVYLP
ncbi:7641_t:CDS:2 [Acaulospora morrowiae]|uniref:7641_t:CDS:1 n=1 Tax=Acaulospora morrowiae TaxID=94023 RepID=A0A9N9AND5_9GLOM|nr:7641_t:CDS:2 [Acaulospora morrowiae]